MEREIRVMTFNIKNSRDFSNPKNIWLHRKTKVLKIIEKYNPNIIGLQEVYEDQLDFLIDNLPEYKYEGIGRDDGMQAGEFSPIFYRELEIQNSGTFWLSDTPDICSNTWGGSNRICTWINFEDIIPFAVYNTHLENSESTIRLKSLPLIISRMDINSTDRPVIFTGDLNFGMNSKEYKEVSQYLYDSHCKSYRARSRWAVSVHGFKGKKKSVLSWNGRLILDYVWVKGSISVQNSQIIYDNPGKVLSIYPSDHWPVISDLTIFDLQ